MTGKPNTVTRLKFLETDATPAQLLRAVATNHVAWMSRNALASGGEIRREKGVTWIYTQGANGEVVLPFPRMPQATAGERLDEILTYCRARTLRQVSCWTVHPTRPQHLGVRLAARGFEWGWQPHWMALDFLKMSADFPVLDGLHIEVDDESDWDVAGLPYYSREEVPLLQAHAQAKPRRIWHFGARVGGKVVGHILLNLTTGPLGVGGIYSLGVLPSARNQGIGKALTLAACQFAQSLGCRYALLNSTGEGEPVYRRLGFESLGLGQTWWMHAPMLAAPPPTSEMVAFAEAVGRGDIRTLESLQAWLRSEDVNAPLLCGMSPMELAVQAGKPAAARWLNAHGATLEILHAWDLGWKDRATQMLATSPELANRRFGGWQMTPLHEAAARGDVELTRLLLTAQPDIDIQDTQFRSTPLGWARHFQRTEIIALLEQYQASGKVRDTR
jgi:GNAT superfamily N-acetyltransferase